MWSIVTLAWFLSGTGFHRTLTINGTLHQDSGASGSCFVNMTLPVVHSFFIDVTQKVKGFEMHSLKSIDLELPQNRVKDEYSVDLTFNSTGRFEIQVPIHFRYPRVSPWKELYVTQCLLPPQIRLDGKVAGSEFTWSKVCASIPGGKASDLAFVRYVTFGTLTAGAIFLIIVFTKFPRTVAKKAE
eukprot:PhF_6_TR14672/c0_g1_i1/m.23132